MKYEIGDTVTDETGTYVGVVCIKWSDGDICTIENDAAHPNPRHIRGKMKGLYEKYIVTKTSGKPIDPNSRFIVLRIDDGQYLHACRAGVAAFAEAVREHNPVLANDLQDLLRQLST